MFILFYFLSIALHTIIIIVFVILLVMLITDIDPVWISNASNQTVVCYNVNKNYFSSMTLLVIEQERETF